MLGKVLRNLRYRVITNYAAKKLMFKLLGSFVFTRNPLYRRAYMMDVRRKIGLLARKPSFIQIENTNLCNLSCIFCANEEMARRKGFAGDAFFKKVIDECAESDIPNVLIQGFGEPFLDKGYLEKVAYAKRKGIRSIHCVTNGILLTRELSQGLIKAGLDYLYISIDAATAEVYGQIHREPVSGIPSDKFSAVIENLENMLELKKKYRSSRPFIEVRFKDFDKNRSDLNRFMKRYRGWVDNVVIYMNIANWPGSRIKNNLPKSSLLKFPCYNLWSTLYITHDGRVALCCQDYECRCQIGDANKQGIMDIWHNQPLKEVRRLHLAGGFAQNAVCNDCVINTQYISPWWP